MGMEARCISDLSSPSEDVQSMAGVHAGASLLWVVSCNGFGTLDGIEKDGQDLK